MKAYQVKKLDQGGYVVIDDEGYNALAVFACSDIAELCAFLRDKFEPKPEHEHVSRDNVAAYNRGIEAAKKVVAEYPLDPTHPLRLMVEQKIEQLKLLG